ncbi:MAG TPA: ATP-binding protein [Rickettsia endosymbiont of Omalisus fontisbellaquei]|nr:ATP-binding protein [Rickettsia endosymbiont of Omalisus fontisbellaquei]
MIKRRIYKLIQTALSRQAAIGLIGPRQVGKTTLALEIAKEFQALYLDLESRSDRDKLYDPELFLREYEDRLVIFDEIHRFPELFQSLRSLIDQGRRNGKRTGRFLILGSASIDLLRQSSESLAGRIEYINLNPLDLSEIPEKENSLIPLWLRGGFPDSFLAENDIDSFVFRENFIQTYLERDVPQFGPRIPAETLERFWIMLAHNQGTILNASRLASGLSVTAPTITKYIDLLVDLLLVRRLNPFHSNIGKRLVKSPKIYIRDSGLTHALLGIETYNDLAGHPVVGASFEGFVIENILSVVPNRTKASFYRTRAGGEIDLLLELPNNQGLWAIEIKRGLAARPTKGFYTAIEDLKPDKAFVVYSEESQYPINKDVEAIGLYQLISILEKI